MTRDDVVFAKETQFFDVEGLPVTIKAGEKASPGLYCACWDRYPPRTFGFDSAIRNGGLISEAAFRKLANLPVRCSGSA
jgi:hypothetical protein